MASRFRTGLMALAWLTLLSACGEDKVQWQLRDISGLMPELQFELTRAADGQTVTASAYADRVVVLFFGFTNCPDICPTTLARFSNALAQLDDEAAERVRVLFVSVDPERDTRERLHNYVNAFGEQFVGLRGPQTELLELTKRYRVTYGYGQPDENGYYDVSHSSAAFVFDEQGEVRLLDSGSASVDEIAHDLRALTRG